MSATPAYEAIEEQLDLLSFYSDRNAAARMTRSVLGIKNPPRGRIPDVDMKMFQESAAKTAADAVGLLADASPYFVASQIQSIIRSGLDSFPDDSVIEERHFPTPVGFALLEDEVALPPSPMGYEQPLKAFGWRGDQSGRGADLWFFGPSRDPRNPQENDNKIQIQSHYRVMYGTPLSLTKGWSEQWADIEVAGVQLTGQDGEEVRERLHVSIRWAVSLIHFMGQRIAALELRPAPRPTRRRFEREARRETPLIRTIVLRVREAKGHYAEETEGGKWTVRSIRRAHWHHYWCGGGSDQCLHPGHKDDRLELRWVEATVCGPDGAPLKRPIDLYSVSR